MNNIINQNFEKENNIFSNIDLIVIFNFGLLLILGNGFLAPPIFGIPIGIINQIIIYPIIIFYIYKKKIRFDLIFYLIFIMNIIGWISIFDSFPAYGKESLRSSTYILDANYILVGRVLANNYLKIIKFKNIFRKILLYGTIYSLSIPFSDILITLSPTLKSVKGNEISLLFDGYETLGLVSIVFFFSENFFQLTKKGNSKIVSLISILITFLFKAARMNYFIFISVFVSSLFLKRKIFAKILIYFFIGFVIFYFIFATGISVSSRITKISGLNFFYEHFLSSFGVDTENIGGATQGFALRAFWWETAIRNVFSTFQTTLLGLGQGIPLTSFVMHTGNVVRDLHNSYVMILARNGLIGVSIFFILHLKLFQNIFINIKNTSKLIYINNFYKTGLLFIIALMTHAIGQSMLEVSFFAVPYYLIWGIVGSYQLEREEDKTIN